MNFNIKSKLIFFSFLFKFYDKIYHKTLSFVVKELNKIEINNIYI